MDIVRAMQVFVSVVDAGSLTAAAADCDMSSTMVGNYLQALERRLGTSLLNRTTRRQHLTEFGKIYYDRCVEILGLVEDADALALQADAAPKGRLRITAPASFGAERLMPALADYAERYPAVELDIVLTDAVVNLVEADFEAAFRIGTLRDSSLVARPLAPYKVMICASPAYLAKHGKPRRPEDLGKHECLAFDYSSLSEWRSARSEWRLTGPDGEISVQIGGRIRVDSAQGLRRAALAGMGIVMLPEVLLSEDISAGRLVGLLPDYHPPTRPLNLLYLRSRRITPKLQSFIAFAIERFGQQASGAN
jgi:DNA-binding transcriptional LysR family regulator